MKRTVYSLKSSSLYPINLLIRSDVRVINPKLKRGQCTFCVEGSDDERAERLLTNFPLQKISQSGAGVTAKKLASRVGLIVSLVAVVFACIMYGFCTFRVEVRGNSVVSTEMILESIKEYANAPYFAKSLDTQSMQRSIIGLEGISSASVHREGTVLKIEVLEEYPPTSPNDILTKNTPILSNHDAVITRVVLRHGTALVKPDDTVKKGAELIAPYTVLDENTKVMTKAGGDVFGRVWYTKSKLFYPQTVTYVRTGNSVRISEIKGFEKISPKKCPYKFYEAEVKTYNLAAGLMPLKMTETVYYETREELVAFDFDAEAEAIITDMTRELEAELPENGEKLRNWYSVKRLDNIVELIIYYELEINIVVY